MLFDQRPARIAFALFMSGSMSLIMSLVITLYNLRSTWTVLHWMQAWVLAFSIAFPLVLLLAPIGQRLVAKLMNQASMPS